MQSSQIRAEEKYDYLENFHCPVWYYCYVVMNKFTEDGLLYSVTMRDFPNFNAQSRALAISLTT